MELSEIIKIVCLELGLSQEELARELHVSFTSVNRPGKIISNQIKLLGML